MTMHALIDGDICLHRVGFTTDNEEFWVAKARLDDMLDKILIDTNCESFQVWLSDSATNNFRYGIYPGYKANRIGKPRPKHLEALKEYAIQEWGARFAEGMEADDFLGIFQDEEHPTTVICSIDKDLKQIPGKHYNFVKEEWEDVTRDRAMIEFYKSIIVGDVSDNIPGAYGMGPVKAEKAIKHAGELAAGCAEDIEQALFEAVRSLWYLSLVKEWGLPWTKEKEAAMQGMILMSGRLLKIKRSFSEPLWDFPLSSPMEAFSASYTPLQAVDNDLCMEPTTQEKSPDGCQSLGSPMESTSLATSLAN